MLTGKGSPASDDDDFFKPASNSTLAKIFGVSKNSTAASRKSPETANQSKVSDRYGASSFRYIPPQQAIDSTTDGDHPEHKRPPEWNLLQASVVTAYKLINETNTPQGKLGLALLRSEFAFRILIYRTKTDALTTLNLQVGTKLFLKNEYLQFRSDDDGFWSVLFEAADERDRLLNTIQDVCILELEQPQQRVPPIPASRTVPIVEEPDSDAEKGKASLISRMARVGKPILPQDNPVSTTEVSDSSDTDAHFETIARPNIPHRRTGGASTTGKIHQAPIGLQMIPSAANALTTAIAGQNLLHTATDVNFNLFMTESRMQGTEVRMNLSKLESKLDRVLDKIDLLNLNSADDGKSSTDKDQDMLLLEEKILELKKENLALKAKVRAMETKVSTKNEDVLKQKLSESEIRYTELQLMVEALQKDLVASRDTNKSDFREFERIKKEQEANIEMVQNKSKEIELLTEQLKDVHKKILTLQENNSMLMKQNEELQATNKTMAQELSTIQTKSSETELHFDELVKTIMNNCFQRMCDQISDARTLKIVGQTIKQETKAALARRRTE
ncbi:FK506-binding protein 15 [Armigeres subalbatus]|uniref:FK506-binding protein 15 n=1 Tax=Armigeres subalbatus TaxID=124917 RepID=UPI002ED1360C